MGKETGKLRAGTAALKACTGGAGHGCDRGRWLRATAQSEVQWLGLETLNWGAGSLVTAAEEASGGRAALGGGGGRM